MKKYLFLFIILAFYNIPTAYADVAITTGFIPGQIWYSKEPLVEGETVKVYTAVWNGDKSTVSTRVEFYDKNVVLGTRDITIEPSQLQDVSISWKVTSGDHTISAKIISSTILNAGKKEQITLDRVATSEDRTFVSATENKGDNVKSIDAVKNNIDKATTALNDVIPSSITEPISTNFNNLDDFRNETYTKIADVQKQTQKELDALNQPVKVTPNKDKNSKDATKVENTDTKPLDATQKPITYIKLFIFSLLGFIFGNKIIFYALLAFLIFILIRFLYRKIRNR